MDPVFWCNLTPYIQMPLFLFPSVPTSALYCIMAILTKCCLYSYRESYKAKWTIGSQFCAKPRNNYHHLTSSDVFCSTVNSFFFSLCTFLMQSESCYISSHMGNAVNLNEMIIDWLLNHIYWCNYISETMM